MSGIYDVAIIGGGPAGSSAATLLAEKGRSVVLFEKENFPRFHIGESLLPYSMGAIDRLGVRSQLDAIGVKKHGGEIATSCGSRAVKFYFKDGFRLEHHHAYQVERSVFDQLLLDRAREAGAEIRQRTLVETFAAEEDCVTLVTRGPGSLCAGTAGDRDVSSLQTRARFVIDCSGRSSVIGRQLGLKTAYEHLRKFSCYAHYRGVQRDPGIDGTLTRLVRADDHWFWLIPIDEQRTSVGLVMDGEDFKKRRISPETALEDALSSSPLMRERTRTSERLSPVHSVSDYSYRNRRLTGPRWMLAGDAAGFIDPIFSTGVFVALHSGHACAEAIDLALQSPLRRPRLFRRYEREMTRIMNLYVRFVSAWYRREFVEVFTTPTQRFQIAPAINAVLAGNTGNTFAIWWRMQLFYIILFLQRYFPLCPRLPETKKSIDPVAATAAV